MKYWMITAIAISLCACKKHCIKTASISNTQWELHFKNNNTFHFFAQSFIVLNANDSITNYRTFDTLTGAWKQDNAFVGFDFNNGDVYSGSIITSDSLSGTLTASGNNGVWYALKK